jgi:hypothetical protein
MVAGLVSGVVVGVTVTAVVAVAAAREEDVPPQPASQPARGVAAAKPSPARPARSSSSRRVVPAVVPEGVERAVGAPSPAFAALPPSRSHSSLMLAPSSPLYRRHLGWRLKPRLNGLSAACRGVLRTPAACADSISGDFGNHRRAERSRPYSFE